MPISRQKKEEILKELVNGFKNSSLVVFVNFHGLSVAAANELRRTLRNISVRYMVAKKTLIKKALEEVGLPAADINLEGEIALAFAEGDPITAAQELNKFAKKEDISIQAGVFENQLVGKETVVMLANIPPRETLLAQFVNIINSPLQGLVSVLNAPIRDLAVVLSEIQKQRS